VLLIDKIVMGAGASGSCDDMILLQSKKPGILLEMAFKSLERFESLKDELPSDIEFETRGGTILIEDKEHLAIMEDFVASQNRYGLEVDIIDRKRLLQLQPLVAEDIIASTYSARDSQVNPMLLMKAFLLGARKNGLEFLSRTRATSVERLSSGWKLLLDSGDSVEAGVIVNAAGAWANDITTLIGFELPITPRKGQVIVTEAIPHIGETNVWSAQYIVSKLKPQVPVKNSSIAAVTLQTPSERFGLGFAFTGTHNGNYLIGSTRENRGFDKSTDPEAIRLLAAQVERFFPVMSKINFIRTFAGLRPSTPDGMPFLGEIPGAPGFFIAAGHEGDGIALSPVTGLVMADLITGKKPEFSMEAFNPGRFGGKAGL
ncbi:MAG: FAD-dependent oxidoreductase, partial [Rectinemataceae bacterium]|nr:FAD-dependent oxidoreductase [Rectinemataceae bacterium]